MIKLKIVTLKSLKIKQNSFNFVKNLKNKKFKIHQNKRIQLIEIVTNIRNYLSNMNFLV